MSPGVRKRERLARLQAVSASLQRRNGCKCLLLLLNGSIAVGFS
jgi:hypothetical protein